MYKRGHKILTVSRKGEQVKIPLLPTKVGKKSGTMVMTITKCTDYVMSCHGAPAPWN